MDVQLPLPGLGRGALETPPARNRVTTYKARVGDSPSVYLQCVDYPDGRLCGIVLIQSRQGTFARGMLDAFAEAVSIALQAGVPVQAITERFRNVKFEPAGFVADDPLGITQATSVVDWVAQVLEKEYVK